jgi:hypothetical protein
MPTIPAGSISEAWKKVVWACLNARGHEICALTVEIEFGDAQVDDLAFRASVSEVLVAENRASVETVGR